jgi:hypothetical protein
MTTPVWQIIPWELRPKPRQAKARLVAHLYRHPGGPSGTLCSLEGAVDFEGVRVTAGDDGRRCQYCSRQLED